MKFHLVHGLPLITSLILSSLNVEASELLLGIGKVVPKTSILFRTFSSNPVRLGEELLNGLQKSSPIAQKILNNCVTTLPPAHEYLQGRFSRISSSVLQIQNNVNNKPEERRSDFMETFPGSSIYKTILTELDEIGVAANQDPTISESEAYKNVRQISVNLGMEPEIK